MEVFTCIKHKCKMYVMTRCSEMIHVFLGFQDKTIIAYMSKIFFQVYTCIYKCTLTCTSGVSCLDGFLVVFYGYRLIGGFLKLIMEILFQGSSNL